MLNHHYHTLRPYHFSLIEWGLNQEYFTTAPPVDLIVAVCGKTFNSYSSREWQETTRLLPYLLAEQLLKLPVLVVITLVPRIMQLGFQSNPMDLNALVKRNNSCII
jgi:hypothetical protein